MDLENIDNTHGQPERDRHFVTVLISIFIDEVCNSNISYILYVCITFNLLVFFGGLIGQ